MYDVAKRLMDRIASALLWTCAVLLTVMTAAVVLLVITRNLMGFSYPWTEELTRYLMVWMAMLGAAVLTLRDDHIALEALPMALESRPKAHAALMIGLRLLMLAMLGLLLQQSWIVTAARASARSTVLNIPISWVYAAIPVAAAIMIVFVLFNIWRDFRRIAGREA